VIGILALQGDYPSHELFLQKRGIPTRRILRPGHLEGLDGLILPGGESSVMLKLLRIQDLTETLLDTLRSGLPVLCTCAGLILLAKDVQHPAQESLGLLDISVERNGYGRQVHSAVQRLDDEGPFAGDEAIFIRAPRITRVADSLLVLARLNGDPVLVQSGSILGACFHPELSDEHPLMDRFLEATRRHSKSQA